MKKISSILAGLVLGMTPTLGISKVAIAGCNFHGCSEVPGVECNFHGCPIPPNGGECNFHGCPAPTSVSKPVENPTQQPSQQIIITPQPQAQPQTPQTESVADCITKILQIDNNRYEGPDYSKEEAREICTGS
jgi:hypothetical protein